MKKRFKRLLTAALATLMCVSSLNLTSFAEEGPVSAANVSNLVNKTASVLDVNDQVDVTLSVPGEQMSLGVDIVYIVGSYATNDDGTTNVEGDVLISSLVETMEEIVASGVPVNFGMVPFSSDNVVAMPLTTITEENLSELPGMIANALDTCEALYDAVNMENALIKSRKMFSESELADHPERQHLVMISSGFTYYFNSGDNNEYVSTVPVRISTGGNNLYYTNRGWMQARTGQGDTYPLPKAFSKYNDSRDWDLYWSYIDQWARADIAAGDEVVYEAATLDAADFLTWYNSGSGKSSGSGKYISGVSAEEATKYPYVTRLGNYNAKNPLEEESAQHAILYERAMWEAYEYAKANLSEINFYPIYNALSVKYTNGYKPAAAEIDWTTQYIGHSFMNMLAGGEAVMYDKQGDKAFFNPIKEQILYTCSIGSTVEDYIGYGHYDENGNFEETGNFEFIQDATTMTLVVGGKTYTTTQIDTKEGADSSYAFTAPGAAEPTFWLDYYYGDGKTTEKFIWTFGENVSLANRASLTYKLQLTEKVEAEGDYTVNTNNSATLYPVDSEGNPGEEQVFPVPNVTYFAGERLITFSKTTSIGEGTTKITYPLEGIQFEIYYAGTVDEYTKYMEDYAKANTGSVVDEIAIQNAFTTEKINTVTDADKVGTVITDINGNAVCNIDKNGVYLIKELPHPAIVKPVDPFVVAVPMVDAEGELTYVIPVNPKNEVLPGPEVEKNVTAIGTEIDSFAVGDVVTWILRGGIPVDIAGGKYYEMYDVLEDSLDYAGILKVVAGAKNAAEGEELVALGAEDYSVSYDTETRTVKFELTEAGMQVASTVISGNEVDANEDGKVNYEDVEIRVYLQTEMNEKAMVGGKIPNQVKLEYRNSVNFYFEDVDDAAAYTCGVRIYKYDAKNKETALAGAKFILAKEVAEGTDGAVQLVTKNKGVVNVVYEDFYTAVEDGELTGLSTEVTTDEDGEAKLYGLDAGEYYLVETKAPEGYNLLSYPVEITVSQNSDDTPIEVANSNQFKLPATGGIGTLVFKICGGALIVAAVVILLTKKRMKNNE